ncbi:MAG: uroporphyrinogen decarboxylase [Bradymonadaceae bacterium]
MDARTRFLRACRCKPVDRPPVWVMRQAGRYLPEYRELREDHSFHDVIADPELAREVTMQPMRRFDLDAAIVFSDILVVPEAMGQGYSFPDGGGIEMDFAADSPSAIDRLDASGVAERQSHVGRALELVREELGGDRALLGFVGAPWTLATYMVEGGSAKQKTECKRIYYEEPELLRALVDKLADALAEFVELQLESGADAVQVFDSWADALAPEAFAELAVDPAARLADAVDADAPLIYFPKGMHHLGPDARPPGYDVLGVDWRARLRQTADAVGADTAVQGNLDPALMSAPPEVVETHARRLSKAMDGRDGFIANLGHGIRPSARPESVERFVQTIADSH